MGAALGARDSSELRKRLDSTIKRAATGWTPAAGPPALSDTTAPERLVLDFNFGDSDHLGTQLSKAARAMETDAPSIGLEGVLPEETEPAHVVTEAVGIGRHARYPANARILLDWLVGEEAQREHAKIYGFYPSNSRVSGGSNQSVPTFDRNAGVAGAFDVDAINLAERAGWR